MQSEAVVEIIFTQRIAILPDTDPWTTEKVVSIYYSFFALVNDNKGDFSRPRRCQRTLKWWAPKLALKLALGEPRETNNFDLTLLNEVSAKQKVKHLKTYSNNIFLKPSQNIFRTRLLNWNELEICWSAASSFEFNRSVFEILSFRATKKVIGLIKIKWIIICFICLVKRGQSNILWPKTHLR